MSPGLLRPVPPRREVANPVEPVLFRDIFPYVEVPRIVFDNDIVSVDLPAEIWITDTTFRDGQQARPPYTPEQTAEIFEIIHRLGGPNGVIRQSEFFLYSEKDRRAVELCLEKNHRFPEVTGWIRAVSSDFELVKSMGLAETGILTSCSDYHIYLKLNRDRREALDMYLGIVKDALDAGVRPRCHFEDITRADFHGFCVPFAQALMELSEESGVPIKIRLCDTMGYGVPMPSASLPRSVPKLVHGMIRDAGVPSERLEWHGHNDFHKVHVNGVAAWLYGCAALNTTLLGFGERTGNPPMEAACIEYAAITGGTGGMDLSAITEAARYFRDELNVSIPKNMPFVGAEFNSTSAGIHADGVAKNEEIYNIFDTARILNRPLGVTINDKSGLAGISHWVNMNVVTGEDEQVTKKHPGVAHMYKLIMKQYDEGRVTSLSNDEMLHLARRCLPQFFESELDRLKARAAELAEHIVQGMAELPELQSMEAGRIQPVLQRMHDDNPFIQLSYVVDGRGHKLVHAAQREDAATYSGFTDTEFIDREWFKVPIAEGRLHVTGLYTSRITGMLCITVSDVISTDRGDVLGVLGADIRFEDLIKSEG
ncbi:MAG: histone-lysine N-methyltransferase [Planctomycetes bacterium]|nr:histone-lysine N-methyltransferase [Planctomycetota bacterium]